MRSDSDPTSVILPGSFFGILELPLGGLTVDGAGEITRPVVVLNRVPQRHVALV